MDERAKQELVGQFRRVGIRVTAQRLAVAEVLAASQDHPDARTVYERAHARIPHITRATVYNTIRTLERAGLVQTLSFPAGNRYDANLAPHANLVCVECGSVEDADVEGAGIRRLRDRIVRKTAFQVRSQRVDFYGVCVKCETAAPAALRSDRRLVR